MIQNDYKNCPPECIIPTVKFGDGEINGLGVVSEFGLGFLRRVKDNVNATEYGDISDN